MDGNFHDVKKEDELFKITVYDHNDEKAFVSEITSKILFTIRADGLIERGPAFTTEDEASLRFWSLLEEIAAKNSNNVHGMPKLERATTEDLLEEVKRRVEMGGGLQGYGMTDEYFQRREAIRRAAEEGARDNYYEARKAEAFRHDMYEARKEAAAAEFTFPKMTEGQLRSDFVDPVNGPGHPSLGDMLESAFKKSREL